MSHRLHLPRTLNEFRRYRAFPIALVVAVLIPLIYSGIYLGAFWNPTGHLDNVPVALVNQDAGATTSSGERLQAGRQVASTILSSDSLQWHEVSASDAADGVANGRYMASVTIPTTFSRALANTRNLSQAELQVRYNDANGYTTRTVVSTVVSKVHDAVSRSLGTRIADQLFLGYTNIHDQLGQAHNGAVKVADGANTLAGGTLKLSAGAGQLASGAATLTSGVDTAAQGAATLAGATSTLHAKTAQAATGAGELASGAEQLATKTPQAVQAAGTIASGAQKLSTASSRAADSSRKLAAAQRTAAASSTQLSTALSKASQQISPAAAGAERLSTGADTLSTGAAGLSSSAGELATALQPSSGDQARIDAFAKTLTPQQAAAFQQIMSGVRQQQAAAATAATKVSLGATTLSGSATQLSAGAKTLSTGLGQAPAELATASKAAATIAGGQTAIAAHQDTLSAGLSTLSTTQTQLATGATTLHTSLGAASTGAATLARSAATLANGVGQLSTGTATLNTSTRTLAHGLGQLSSGSGTLAASSKTLAGSMQTAAGASQQVATGTGKVADGLASAQQKVPSYSDAQASRNATAAASPVRQTETWLHQAANNGEGFAPFFIGLSLFVGGIVMWLLLRPITARHLLGKAPARLVVASQWIPGAILAVAGSATLVAVLHWAMGMHVAHLPATFGVAALAAAAFVALQQAMIIWLKPGPGRLACIILLVLQLGSASGTYPVATAPAFFRAISGWMPLTHIVTALRQSITGSIDGGFWASVAFLAVMLVSCLAASTLGAFRSRTWTVSTLHPALRIGS